MAKKDLTSEKPREKTGRDTTLRFDYQHRFAAEAALEILEDNGMVCVYCDYHDDFVTQRLANNSDAFEFVQVKTNKKEKHQFDFPDVFGIPKTSKGKANPSRSFGGKLFYHQLAFKDQCSDVTLLTNVFVVDDIETLINDVKSVTSISDLAGESKKWFDKILTSYKSHFNVIDSQIVFDFLKKFKIRSNAGSLNDDDKNHSAIFLKKIFDFSEVTLNQAEAYKIYAELISKVREKSMKELDEKITPDELKNKAGIVLDDLLSVLSITKSGYQILKSGGDQNAIRSTSRLQRFLQARGATQEMIEIACHAKVSWDNWIRENRHAIGHTDLLLLTTRCSDIIRNQNALNRSVDDLIAEFETISQLFSGKLDYVISKDLVFGLFLSLVVKGEK